MTKKITNKLQMFFSVITKNLSWDILTKSLAIFKRWHAVKDEKL